jgi:biopolymer transport protein ExbD
VNLRPRKQTEPELNLTPLIDVVFLLLFFFTVSTTFHKDSQIQVELPEASRPPESVPPPESLAITVDREGRFYVDQQEVVNTDIETLKRAMAKAIEGRADLPVSIDADAQTPYQSVITAMDAASQLGLVHITFATRQSDEP